jgi:hypothetical protein
MDTPILFRDLAYVFAAALLTILLNVSFMRSTPAWMSKRRSVHLEHAKEAFLCKECSFLWECKTKSRLWKSCELFVKIVRLPFVLFSCSSAPN